MSEHDFDEYQEDVTQLIAHYEEMEKNDSNFFFEESSFEQIIDYYEERQKNDKALKVIDLAICQYPYSSIFLIKKAQFLFDIKQFDLALELLERAEIFDPKDMQIFLLRSDIYVWMEEYKKATQTIERAIELADEDEVVDMYLELADIYEEWEKYEQVFESLKKALLLEPTNDEALNRMWFCTEFTEKYQESIDFHNKIIDREPYCYLAWFNVAHAYGGLELYEKAVESFEYVIAINDKYDHAYKDCADMLVKLKQHKKAADYYKQAIDLSKPTKDLFFNMGECHENMGDCNRARYYYRKSIKVDPCFDEAFFKIGLTYKKEDRWTNALSSFERAYKLNTDNPFYLTAMAEAYKKTDDVENSIGFLRKALEVKSSDKDLWIKLAKTLFEAELYRDALDTLDEASGNFEKAADLYFIKSAFYYLIGNRNESYLNLESALLQEYDNYPIIFDIAPVMETDGAVASIIDQYR